MTVLIEAGSRKGRLTSILQGRNIGTACRNRDASTSRPIITTFLSLLRLTRCPGSSCSHRIILHAPLEVVFSASSVTGVTATMSYSVSRLKLTEALHLCVSGLHGRVVSRCSHLTLSHLAITTVGCRRKRDDSCSVSKFVDCFDGRGVESITSPSALAVVSVRHSGKLNFS